MQRFVRTTAKIALLVMATNTASYAGPIAIRTTDIANLANYINDPLFQPYFGAPAGPRAVAEPGTLALLWAAGLGCWGDAGVAKLAGSLAVLDQW